MGSVKLDTPSDTLVDDEKNLTPSWMAFVTKVKNFIVWRSQAGTTAQRPTSGLEIGTTFYDTTLGFLICVHQVTPAVVWHNGAGAVV